ncbi:liver carboxylesterase 1F-like [Mantella aurantiaca]
MCPQNAKHFGEMMKLSKVEKALPPTSEDCLYLNVFTPSDREPNARLPVMVSMLTNGSSLQDGSALSAYENVVLVSIQYRLGTLGFLSTRDDGNYGLLDQAAALRWVQGNIKNFGGDPGSVTVSGELAGAMRVSALKTTKAA